MRCQHDLRALRTGTHVAQAPSAHAIEDNVCMHIRAIENGVSELCLCYAWSIEPLAVIRGVAIYRDGWSDAMNFANKNFRDVQLFLQ